MARLTTLRPLVATMPRAIANQSEDRDAAAPWRKWYRIARWRALRWEVLLRASFTCAMCNRLEGDTAKLVADHIIPHKGSESLFWSATNLQCLCAECHSKTKQRDERRSGY